MKLVTLRNRVSKKISFKKPLGNLLVDNLCITMWITNRPEHIERKFKRTVDELGSFRIRLEVWQETASGHTPPMSLGEGSIPRNF